MQRAAPAALAALLLAAPLRASAAQNVCAGRPIRRITIHTAPVTDVEGRRFPPLIQGVANAISWQTHPDVVRRELRFAEGDRCDPERLRESARVLRSPGYIRSAVITTRLVRGDSVDVDVVTRDDWALGGSVAVNASGPRALRAIQITENDLFGRGMLGQVHYDYYGRHAGLVFDVLDRQFMGSRTDAEVVAGRSSVGPDWELSFRRPFESEYDRVGWRAAVRYREEPFSMVSTVFGSAAQPLVSTGAELATIGRIGRRGKQLVAGLALSVERLFITDQVLASDPAQDSAAAAALQGRFTERRRVAASFMLGARDVRFVTRSGVDAVNATEDIREGVEVLAIAGHTLGSGGGLQHDVFGLADLYVGAEFGDHSLGFLRGRIEGRRLLDTDAWDDVIGAVDAFLYTGVGERGGMVFTAQGAGGWHTTAPFQLVVSSPRTMRGFGLSALPAGQRVVVQAEHRYFLGTLFGALDLGTAAFVDVGRGWAGDAPFGENTGTLVAAGGGLRIGFPSGSRLTTRLDLAVPLRGGKGVEFRLTVGRQFGISAPAPDDVERSRMPISTIDLFSFQRY
ncbi:MAG: hypothetical protein ACHQU8_03970 [Gemmatimonadales bacterium]